MKNQMVLTSKESVGSILLDNIAGISSTMSNLSLYIYNYTVIPKHQKAIRKLFLDMCGTAMEQLLTFNTLVFELGMDPRLWTSHDDYNEYWSPSYNNYSKQLSSILKEAIINKKKTIDKYRFQTESINDSRIVSILQHCIHEECQYLQQLETFYAQLRD